MVDSRSLQFRVWCALQAAIEEYLAGEKKNHRGDDGDPMPCLFDCAGAGFQNAWGHPGTSHKFGDTFDLGYFTTGKTNRTQNYGARRQLWDDYPFTDPALHHPARTVRFLRCVLNRFPKMRYMVHAVRYNELRPYFDGNKGPADRILDGASNIDQNPEYHHDAHIHFYLFGFQAEGKYVPGMIV